MSQNYVTESDNEYVILGNDALMKCDIPSFVSDLIEIQSWIDSEENMYLENSYSSSFSTYILTTQKLIDENSCMSGQIVFSIVKKQTFLPFLYSFLFFSCASGL